MILARRIELMARLGSYMLSDDPAWILVREMASQRNPWFTPEFVTLAVRQIGTRYLQAAALNNWVSGYPLNPSGQAGRRIGLVMAGNIPLVGFHDFLCVFLSGHSLLYKPSSRDEVLIRHLAEKLVEWEPEAGNRVQTAEMLRECDAYIATGSNNTAGYFDYYFRKYPHIIRRNRTSVAVLSGSESPEELSLLADDVYQYFGLGCRNVTKVYVPEGYDFIPLLRAFDRYNYLADYHKYKNNYDYNLAILILNKKPYMSNASLLLVEEASPFSPIGQLHYERYPEAGNLLVRLRESDAIQCVVGAGGVPFGSAQHPALSDYADGIDTLQFLSSL